MVDPDFEPVAIVGAGCVLPGAHSPEELWKVVVEGRSALSETPAGRYGLTPEEEARTRHVGGFVTGFAPLEDEVLQGVDMGVHWLVHAGRWAWAQAEIGGMKSKRVGVIVGNLGYPTRSFCDLMADVWEGREITPEQARSRLNTGGPAGYLARALSAKGGHFALDAACASSLYAMKLACDRLQDGRLDVAVVGAMNAVDHLMLQQGFIALKATSPTGRSRPLMAGADGLIPAEGAAAVVLRRLSDVPAGQPMLGVIRGVGLSNDGNRKGLLVPDGDGQIEAMQRAWAMSGLDPARDIGLIEAHATGTAVGDGVEVAASAQVFGAREGLPIGSLKSNTGHLITAAGLGGLIKVTQAFAHRMLPPTRVEGEMLPALKDSPLRLVEAAEEWPDDLPMRAGLSTFGFGGNNAHLVVEADDGWRPEARKRKAKPAPLSVVGLGLNVGAARGVAASLHRLSRVGAGPVAPAKEVIIDPRGMRTPPADLKAATAQQAAVFDVVDEALTGVDLRAPERIGVFVGFACATESARWMWRERLQARLGAGRRKDEVAAPMGAADVTGAMPNVSANRLNGAINARGQGFALMAEGASGAAALETAADALRKGEIDLAIIAAVDFADSDEVRAIWRALGVDAQPLDGAAAIVLKRETDTEQALARIKTIRTRLEAVPGSAADGLVTLVADIAAGRMGWRVSAEGVAPDARPGKSRETEIPGASVKWKPDRVAMGDLVRGVPELKLNRATKADGELAFVFTGAAAAYPGMGRGLFAAFPELVELLKEEFPSSTEYLRLLGTSIASPLEQLQATTLLSQAQHRLLTRVLGVKPTVAMGLSSGETNSLMAFGAWNDPDALMAEIAACGMYERDLGGAFETARTHWELDASPEWATWRVFAPVEAVDAAIAGESLVELTIVYAPEDCVVAGEAESVQRALGRLGEARRVRVNHDLTVHGAAMTPYAETWRALHARKTKAPEGVRFYANAVNGAYVPSKKRCADMLTRQALTRVNFPATVEQAWEDGVRTFVEIGPRDTLTGAIGQVLGDRPHTAVAMDAFGQDGVAQLCRVVETLAAAGHEVDSDALERRLGELRANAWPVRNSRSGEMTIPAHIKLPKISSEPVVVSKAIPLPSPPKRPDFAPLATELKVAAKKTPAPRTLSQPAPPKPPRKSPKRPPARLPNPLDPRAPGGQRLSREELEYAAYGQLSEMFGEGFAPQDGYARQVRMPRPPLLLCDRVTGIEAEPLVLGKGVIWTETDVTVDHWAVDGDGFMRLGPMVEAGQADLLLISYMGVDLLNKSERIYRLLGCELTFHPGGLPRIGDTLRFQIEITGHTELNGVRMFFISYDCWCNGRLLLSVRSGQAGFFTDEELAQSKGVLWSAEADDPPTEHPRMDGFGASAKRAFSAEDVELFRVGDAYACFGAGFERCGPQSRPPIIPAGRLALFDDVEEFRPLGGPWGRGYLKARQHVPVDAWFYDGHFHNDPCMPGTLMVEAAVQVMSFMMAALGMTVEADSHVFEPVDGAPMQFICRGQVTPDRAHDVTYEVFVDEIIGGATPTLYAALLASSDGKKVFYCPRFGLRLRPHWSKLSAPGQVARIVGPSGDVRGDEGALIEMASGAPSAALGSMYAKFDRAGRLPRLPSPPYHMVSRIVSVDRPPGEQAAGVTAVAEYDVPEDAWYFRDGGTGHIPLSVLTEIALQPCGWLAGYAGLALGGDSFFRNLDGKGEVLAEVAPDVGTLRVTTTLSSVFRAGALIIVCYDLQVGDAAGNAVMTLKTSFGFFTENALAAQAGLKLGEDDRGALDAKGRKVSLKGVKLALQDRRLAMVDKVDFWQPEGGRAGLGLIRGRQAVDPYAWYFKAHFFSDPVQPGSLGLEALVQLLGAAVGLKGLDAGIANARLQSVAAGQPITWTYRGQVTPEAKEVTTLVEITSVEEEGESRLVRARGTLFVDGLRIYEMPEFALRVVPGEAKAAPEFLSPVTTPWLASHRPTHTRAALPLMAMAGMALRVQGEAFPATIRDFAPKHWAIVDDGGVEIEVCAKDGAIEVSGRDAADPDAPRRVLAAGRAGEALPQKASVKGCGVGAKARTDLYQTHELFHGPDLQPVTWLRRDARGFEMEIDLAKAHRPGDPFDPVILDGLVHGVPHQNSEDWFDIDGDMVIYPVRIDAMGVFGPLPKTGKLKVRGAPMPGAEPPHHLPIRIEAETKDGLWAVIELVEKAYPKGRFGTLAMKPRVRFITGEQKSPYAVLSEFADGESWLAPADVMACDWLPGSVAATYGAGDLTGAALVRCVAVKEHFAKRWRVHPREVEVDAPFVRCGGKRARFALSFDRERRAWRVGPDPA